LGAPYSAAQMTYDLRRLRLKGLIRRLEHQNRYIVTSDGIKAALFYTKLQDRLLRPFAGCRSATGPPGAPACTSCGRTLRGRLRHQRQYRRVRGLASMLKIPGTKEP